MSNLSKQYVIKKENEYLYNALIQAMNYGTLIKESFDVHYKVRPTVL